VKTVSYIAKETEKIVTIIMKTYLGENPAVSGVIEFLCLVEGDEAAHYEVLEAISKKFDRRKTLQ
jgi:hypothetical protein